MFHLTAETQQRESVKEPSLTSVTDHNLTASSLTNVYCQNK